MDFIYLFVKQERFVQLKSARKDRVRASAVAEGRRSVGFLLQWEFSMAAQVCVALTRLLLAIPRQSLLGSRKHWDSAQLGACAFPRTAHKAKGMGILFIIVVIL